MKENLEAKPQSLVRVLRHLYGHLSRQKCWQLGGLIVLMLIGGVAELATLGAVVPFLALLADQSLAFKFPLLQQFFEYLGWDGRKGILLPATCLFVVVAILATGMRLSLTWASLKFSFGIGSDIGVEVYRRTLYQPYNFHVVHNTSETISALNKVHTVVYSVISPLVQGLVSLVIALAILGALVRIDLLIAAVAGIGFALLYIGATLITRRRLRANSRLIAENETFRVRAIQEGLGGIRDVLISDTQPVFIERFRQIDVAQRKAQAINNFISSVPRYLIEAVGMVLIAVLAYWLSQREGGLPAALPVLGGLAIGAQRLIPQMQQIYSCWASVSGNYKALADVLGILDQKVPNEYLRSTPSSLERRFREGIAVLDVSFKYHSDAREVIRKVTLEIPRGSRIGFIGKTGSGKTTLIDLITGLLEPTRGTIEIDGQPLTATNRREWQACIAHVPQSIYLADATIAENIAFGLNMKNIDMVRVVEAARKAQLSDFVETLPTRYETNVGERGVRLSGGQRQRIGIARALYKKAEVLVLDEATSALDDATESVVMNAIEKLGDEITVLMIAHRLSTLGRCDWIYEFKDGQVLREGTYQQIVEPPQKVKSPDPLDRNVFSGGG